MESVYSAPSSSILTRMESAVRSNLSARSSIPRKESVNSVMKDMKSSMASAFFVTSNLIETMDVGNGNQTSAFSVH